MIPLSILLLSILLLLQFLLLLLDHRLYNTTTNTTTTTAVVAAKFSSGISAAMNAETANDVTVGAVDSYNGALLLMSMIRVLAML